MSERESQSTRAKTARQEIWREQIVIRACNSRREERLSEDRVYDTESEERAYARGGEGGERGKISSGASAPRQSRTTTIQPLQPASKALLSGRCSPLQQQACVVPICLCLASLSVLHWQRHCALPRLLPRGERTGLQSSAQRRGGAPRSPCPRPETQTSQNSFTKFYVVVIFTGRTMAAALLPGPARPDAVVTAADYGRISKFPLTES